MSSASRAGSLFKQCKWPLEVGHRVGQVNHGAPKKVQLKTGRGESVSNHFPCRRVRKSCVPSGIRDPCAAIRTCGSWHLELGNGPLSDRQSEVNEDITNIFPGPVGTSI